MEGTHRYKNAYKHYIERTDELRCRLPKGMKDKIKDHAHSMGEPIHDFIVRALDETMKRDIRKREADRKSCDRILAKYEQKEALKR